MTQSLLFRSTAPLAGGLALILAAGCPSDDNDVEPDAEPEEPDADPDAPDADPDPDAEPTPEDREGLAAITDVDVLDDGGSVIETGARTDIRFFEPGTGDGEVTHDGDYCTVTTFEDGEYGPAGLNEGPVEIAGTESGVEADGSFTCEYYDGGYECVMDDDADQDITAEGTDDGFGPFPGDETIEVTFEDKDDFDGFDLVGGWAYFEGFDDGNLNETYFPIVGQENNQVEIDSDLLGDDRDATTDGDGEYKFVIGHDTFAENPQDDFLVGDDVDNDVVTVAAEDTSDYVENFDVGLFPLGDGMVLTSGDTGDEDIPYLQVEEFLTDEDHGDLPEVRFSCDDEVGNEDGECHQGLDEGDFDDLGDTAFVVSGRTTDDDDGDFGEADTRAEFECAFPDAQLAEVSDEAIEYILATEPTFVETQVSYLETAEASDGDVTVKVGHTLESVNEVAEELLEDDD